MFTLNAVLTTKMLSFFLAKINIITIQKKKIFLETSLTNPIARMFYLTFCLPIIIFLTVCVLKFSYFFNNIPVWCRKKCFFKPPSNVKYLSKSTFEISKNLLPAPPQAASEIFENVVFYFQNVSPANKIKNFRRLKIVSKGTEGAKSM